MLSSLFAYESSLNNLVVPSTIESPSLEATFEHRFGRALGMSAHGGSIMGGANIGLGMRGEIWKGIGATFYYTYRNNEFDGAVTYSQSVDFLQLDILGSIHAFTYQKSEWNNFRATNAAYDIALQSKPLLFDHLVLNAGMNYDGYNAHVGLGLGTTVQIIEKVALVGELFPLIPNASNVNIGSKPCFSAGIKYDTYGHHFKLSVANSTELGQRHAMLGTNSKNVYFGFSIQRHVSFE